MHRQPDRWAYDGRYAYDDDMDDMPRHRPSLLTRALGERPLDRIALFSALLIGGAVFANALWMQPGPHPAPLFAKVPRPAIEQNDNLTTGSIPSKTQARAEIAARSDLVLALQQELAKRGLYEGAADGVMGPRTDAAIRDAENLLGLKESGEASDLLLQRLKALRPPQQTAAAATRGPADPIGDLLSGSKRTIAVQRALSDFGYGPIKVDGMSGPDTRKAIERFERERRMPVSGQVSDRLIRELAAVTGRPLE